MFHLSKRTNTTFENIPLDASFYSKNISTFTTSSSTLKTLSSFVWLYGWEAIKLFWQASNSLK